MIREEDRKALIAYRIRQAFETADLARFLVASGKFTVAVNRIYYSMYYALTALALKYQFETSKHSQLMGWFNKEFIATRKADTFYGKSLRNAFRNRTKGDYDAFIEFTSLEVESMLSEMTSFIEKINSLLKE